MNRRDFVSTSLIGAFAATMAPRIVTAQGSPVPTSPGNYSSRAIDLVGRANVVDMLAPIEQARMIDGRRLTEVWLSEPGSFTEDDAREYLAAGVNVYALGDLLPDSPADELKWFAKWNGFIASNSQYFDRIDTLEKLGNAQNSGKIGLILTLQTSFHFRELDDVDLFHSLGQRVGQLSHNRSNHIATAGFDDDDKGLSDFGADVVERMQQVGLAVDVSHCSDKTTLQTLEIAKRPILFTHAPCRALNPGYARAKTDDMIRKMADTGGVMGIAILRFFARDREPVTVEHFFDHIDHVVKVAGIEHVGIGSDQGFDTEDQLPLEVRRNTIQNAPAKYKVHSNDHYQISIEGINHRKRIFDITEGLIRRGYSDEHILLILGGNFARALGESWDV